MEAEKLQINMGNSQKADITIRETREVNELPVQEPRRLEITGTLDAVHEFLMKRWNAADGQIDHCKTHIIVDRDNVKITLVTNENDERNSQTIVGRLEYSREYLKFHINEDFDWQPETLGQFCKMYRSCFADKQKNMELVSLLKNFKAKVHTDMDRSVKENGSYTDNFSQIVDSNVPSAFTLQIPVFKGGQKQNLEVETFAHIDGREVTLSLISAGAVDTIETVRDLLINEQIQKLQTVFPEIPIVEI